MARKVIDKNIRDNVWRRYWGNIMDGQCLVCGKRIEIGNFDCGHIISVSNRGDDNILNLVPICRGCNLGMGEENLLDYKKRAFSHINVQSLVQPKLPDIYVKEEEVIYRQTKMTAKSIDDDIDDQRQGTMIAQPIDEDFFEKDKRERYRGYSLAVKRILPDIKKMISSAKGKEIKFKVMDIAKDLGKDFTDKNPTTIYWGLKYVLFKEGIFVETSSYSGEKLLVMRCVTPDDELPPSLAKFLELDGVQPEISERTNGIKKKTSSDELRNMLEDLPSSLGHTLEVYYYILDGLTRSDATNLVAKRKDITPSTIASSYTRQLDKSTSEIDILMQPENNDKFKKVLIAQFPEYIDKINEFFSNGIIVGLTTFSGEKLLTMRDATPNDKLYASLAKMSGEKRTIDTKIDYQAAIQNILPEIKDVIAKGERFDIYVNDLIKRLGKGFENKDPRVIYWGIKYLFFNEGITVYNTFDMSQLYMHKTFPGYRLPSRLGKDFKPFEDDLETDLDYYPPRIDCTNKKIVAFNFDRSFYEVNTWIGLLEKLVEVIYEKHKNEFYKILNLQNLEEKYNISNYFSTDQKELHKPRKVAEVDNKDIYIETKLPANKIVDACYFLIREFGYSDDDLKIEMN